VSVPARALGDQVALPRPARGGRPRRPAAPGPRSAPRTSTARTRAAARRAPSAVRPGPVAAHRPVRTGARRGRLAFTVLAAALASLAVTGVVALNALVAQREFRIEALEERIDGLADAYRARTEEAARLSAPRRIAAWARRHGMRLPDEVHILHLPGPDRAASVGEPRLSELALEPIVEGGP
jgi:cell division protein FtsL